MEECPYCNEEIEINHDDGCGYQEDEVHEAAMLKFKKQYEKS